MAGKRTSGESLSASSRNGDSQNTLGAVLTAVTGYEMAVYQ